MNTTEETPFEALILVDLAYHGVGEVVDLAVGHVRTIHRRVIFSADITPPSPLPGLLEVKRNGIGSSWEF